MSNSGELGYKKHTFLACHEAYTLTRIAHRKYKKCELGQSLRSAAPSSARFSW